jgi:hypothetical protein
MPVRKGGPRRKTTALTEAEFWELSVGPLDASAFESDAARRAAWLAHRDELREAWPSGRTFAEKRYELA